MIPKIRAAVARYPYKRSGDYSVWPGPNSNSFVAYVLGAIPEAAIALPPTAVGKDWRVGSGIFGLTPSGTGLQLSLAGLFGVTIGWVEGVEINVLGLVAGIDIRRPAIKLPGFGRHRRRHRSPDRPSPFRPLRRALPSPRRSATPRPA